jgi:2-polyprenyl-3-methyl-5-hydroxy-6-metoxy-1,4-benzoquinol methylase
MKYAFKNANLPSDKTLLRDIEAAASRLADKLSKVDVGQLSISDYNKRYFGGMLQNITATLQLRSYLLALALDGVKIPKEKIVVIDYGGGSGIFSLLAKEYGIGKVVYDDIYDVSCRDAEMIGIATENKADYYINGDIDNLIEFMRNKNLSCTAIVSYDVIEHIYDMDSFLRKLGSLSKDGLNIVLSSAANIKNPFMQKFYHKKQLDLELNDRQPVWGSKERDSLKSYLNSRKEIIEQYIAEKNKSLSKDIIDDLAKRTRGLMLNDIRREVDQYLQTGSLPVPLRHPTNTCDPYTGNWAEHLMDQDDLKNTLTQAGFETKILPGYYGDSNDPKKRFVKRGLNRIISVSGQQGLRLSGFFTLYAVRNANGKLKH